LLTIELAKHGFGPADLHGCINFFSKVAIADDTRAPLTYEPGHARAGDTVTLRAEQDLLLFISTAPHPLATQNHREPAIQQEPPADPHTAQRADVALSGRRGGGVGVRTEVAGDGEDIELREEALRALELTRELIA
jgi:hypothetical protein